MFPNKMTDLLHDYHMALDNSNFDVGDIMTGFRAINDEFGDKMKAVEDSKNLEYVQLEHEMLQITKTIDNGLSPKTLWTEKDDEGREISSGWPNFHAYNESIINYFHNRYLTTTNIYLKTEYGLFIYIQGNLLKNSDKKVLTDSIIELINRYWTKFNLADDAQYIYRFSFFNKLMDIFLILSRAGKPLEAEFKKLLFDIENRFLSCKIENKTFFHFSEFIVTCYVNHKKKIKEFVDFSILLTHLQNGTNHLLKKEPELGVRAAKSILLFSQTFALKPKENYSKLIAMEYEEMGDKEIANENWIGGIKNYEDSLKYYAIINDIIGINKMKSNIDSNKGKVKMHVFQSETSEAEFAIINGLIQSIVESNNHENILNEIAGNRFLPDYKSHYEDATSSANEISFLNLLSVHTLDKFGNVSRVYDSKEDKILHDLFETMGLACQRGFQITLEILKRSLREKKITCDQIESHFKATWLNEKIELNYDGDVVTVVPIEAIWPSVKSFIDELTKAVQTKGYKPNFICSIDSMVVKIEYAIRNLCFKLGISTFRFRHTEKFMTAEEIPLSGLLVSLEKDLSENDIWLIRLLLNEKGGNNLRNRAVHGLLDSNEYTVYNALIPFTILLRLSSYDFS